MLQIKIIHSCCIKNKSAWQLSDLLRVQKLKLIPCFDFFKIHQFAPFQSIDGWLFQFTDKLTFYEGCPEQWEKLGSLITTLEWNQTESNS